MKVFGEIRSKDLDIDYDAPFAEVLPLLNESLSTLQLDQLFEEELQAAGGALGPNCQRLFSAVLGQVLEKLYWMAMRSTQGPAIADVFEGVRSSLENADKKQLPGVSVTSEAKSEEGDNSSLGSDPSVD